VDGEDAVTMTVYYADTPKGRQHGQVLEGHSRTLAQPAALSPERHLTIEREPERGIEVEGRERPRCLDLAAGRDTVIALTAPWHERDAQSLVGRVTGHTGQ
jgi:hypothetical protein